MRVVVMLALLAAACVDPGPTEPTGGEAGQGVVVEVVEGANGSHIWMRPEDGQVNKLHLRGPNTYSYDASAPAGSYSQINLYADDVGIWGGTQPNGKAIYIDQQGAYPREDGTLDLGTRDNRWRDLRLAGVLRSSSLAGDTRRYACIEIDGTLTASETPCTEGE